MRDRGGMVVVAMVIAAGAWVFYSSARWISRTGPSAPVYSSLRYDPGGCAAVYDMLGLRGIPVERLYRGHLMSFDHGTLVQVLPLDPKRGDHKDEDEAPPTLGTNELVKWIGDGNTVVQFTREDTALMKQMGVPWKVRRFDMRRETQKHERAGKDPGATPGLRVHARTTGGLDLQLIEPSELRGHGRPSWHPLARSTGGEVVAGEVRFGRGRFIVVASPTPALNGGIDREQNLEFVLSLVSGHGPVLIDEWSHGVRDDRTVLGLIRSAGLTPVLFQLFFVLLVYHWSTRGYRRIDAPGTPRARSCTEQIQTLAHLYSRTLDAAEVQRRVEHEVRTRLAAALRCRPAQLDDRIKSLVGVPAQRVRDVLEPLGEAAAAIGSRRTADAAWARALTRSHQFLQESHREH